MNTVIAALDVTGCAEEVIGVAERLATAMDARLVLLSCWQLPRSVPRSLDVHGDTAAHTLQADLETHLELFAASGRAAGLQVEVVAREGTPVETVLGAADDLEADWIVVGTHARKGLARVVLGSVAEQIIRHAKVPVVAVRAQHLEAQPGLSEAQLAVAAEGDG